MRTDEQQHAGFQIVHSRTGAPIQLAMESLWLSGTVLAVGARLVMVHTFRSNEEEPLEVVYSFGLPRDAALRRFIVRGEGFHARSELKPVHEAVRAYEKGIEEGHLSTLARQYRDGVVNLNLGNLRPGESVQVFLEMLAGVETRDESIRFRFPFTLAPCYHAQARTVEAEPGVGEIELPEEDFGDVILPPFLARADQLHQVGFDLKVDLPGRIMEVGSPSHALKVRNLDQGPCQVSLAAAQDVPDRDLVLDVKTEDGLSGVMGGVGKDRRVHFACVIPSKHFGSATTGKKKVVFVLDRSSSMHGKPFDQARKALEACLAALSAEDQFALVTFDDRVEVFRDRLVPADRAHRDAACKFLEETKTRGGTELAHAVTAAVRLLRDQEGHLFLATDGQVYATEDILQTARSAHVRIHCLGIGSASQDRFLALLARETDGVSRFVTPRERVDLTAVELFTHISRPVAVRVKVGLHSEKGEIMPPPPQSVFEGTPLVVFGSLKKKGTGKTELQIEWDHDKERGRLEVPIDPQRSRSAEVVRLLRGSRLITDLESRWKDDAKFKREQKRIEERLLALSEEYGLANRAMALVAVVERKDDQPGRLPQTTVVGVGMPQDVGFGSYFGSTMAMTNSPGIPSLKRAMSPGFFCLSDTDLSDAICEARTMRRGAAESLTDLEDRTPEEVLLDLARSLEPDGGMPGDQDSERILRTIAALFCFLIQGHTMANGTFRMHVRKMAAYLKAINLRAMPSDQSNVVVQALQLIQAGQAPPVDWFRLCKTAKSGNKTVQDGVWKVLDGICA